ncbi:hypothetical protein BaRGS_00002691, partial [Batillaria attramentaria]
TSDASPWGQMFHAFAPRPIFRRFVSRHRATTRILPPFISPDPSTNQTNEERSPGEEDQTTHDASSLGTQEGNQVPPLSVITGQPTVNGSFRLIEMGGPGLGAGGVNITPILT